MVWITEWIELKNNVVIFKTKSRKCPQEQQNEIKMNTKG